MVTDLSRPRYIWMEKLPAKVQSALHKQMKTLHLKDGDILFQQGSQPEGIYEIQQGRIKAFVTSPSGKQVSLNIFSAPDLLGEANILTHAPLPQTTQALGDAQLGFISIDAFNSLRDTYPEIDEAMLIGFSHKLLWMNNYVISISTQDLETRLAIRLCRLVTRELDPDTDNTNQHYRLECTQDHLAELLGATRQSINKVLKAWEAEGIVENQYGTLIVNDLQRLSDKASIS
ncbi:Crp/Fnr family transcriptional regulator [Maricurvus nonylphenolicus]|uniref:Crp/Fnr family transcriptional regulator n=1 Tax=Maricurvus nonylphenolicus TaxID=1008307 RepID=UPI0036F43E25